MQIKVSSVFFGNSISRGKNMQSNINNATLHRNDISFCSQDVSQALRMQALRSANNSMITDSKTSLGANYNKETNSIDFKLASQNADDVVLCIFDKPKGEDAKFNIKMDKKEGTNIWKTSVPLEKLENGTKPVYYGYRVFGPNYSSQDGFKELVDDKGNRFNPNKLAFDPYSKELSHLPSDNPKGEDAFIVSDENYLEDNAKYAPKSVFSIPKETIIPKASQRALVDEVIGEVHIKDLSINEDVQGAGTYLGAKNMAKKLKDMGFTMIEFLPLQEFDPKQGGSNHWGYMTLGFFAPAKRYSSDKSAGGALREFREMIKEFHKNDLKVCMDVVYNHTGEAGLVDNDINKAKQTSFSLIDNQMYYKQKAGVYNSNSGCGNDTNTAQEEVMNLVADSVAFWAKQGVDAFRFDLGVGLMDINKTNEVYYDPQKSLIGKLSSMLKERGVNVLEPNQKGDGIYLIVEPWTCGGENSYQLGNFPKEWAQWNDFARETYKRDSFFPQYLNISDLSQVLEGSCEKLKGSNQSINYVFSHDGYSLADSNTIKSPEGSWHFATDFDGDTKRQESSMKKQIALTLLSKGTPMLQVGDVIAHSKGGVDNSYNRDDKTNYLDFSKAQILDSRENRIFEFSKKMIDFRKKHPELTDCKYNKLIKYYRPCGTLVHPKDKKYMQDNNIKILGYKITGLDENNSLFISTSSSQEQTNITLPKAQEGKNWYLVCDTSRENSFVEGDEKIDYNYVQNPHSLLIFEER